MTSISNIARYGNETLVALNLPEVQRIYPNAQQQDALAIVAQAIGTAQKGKALTEFVANKLPAALQVMRACGAPPMPAPTVDPACVQAWTHWLQALPEVQAALKRSGPARPGAIALLHYLHGLAKLQDGANSAKAPPARQMRLQDVRERAPAQIPDVKVCVMVFALPATRDRSGNARPPRPLLSTRLVPRTELNWMGCLGPPPQPELEVSISAFFGEDGQPKGDYDAASIAQISNEPWQASHIDSWRGFVAEIDRRCQAMFGGQLHDFAAKVFGRYSSTPVVLLIDEAQLESSLWSATLDKLLKSATAPAVVATALAGIDPGQRTRVRIATSPRAQFLGMMDSRTPDGAGRQTVHPLDFSQRLATMQAMTLRPVAGQCILPVNGPPGTGKTSFLKSVLASFWVKAALEQAAHPPIVFGTAATNKAVTNVIEAFSDVPGLQGGTLAGRWLQGLPSYGWFFPSREAADNHPDFMQLSWSFELGGSAKSFTVFSAQEHANSYIAHARAVLPELAPRGASKPPDVTAVIHALHARISQKRITMVEEIKDFEKALFAWQSHARGARATAWPLRAALQRAADLKRAVHNNGSRSNKLQIALKSGRAYLAHARLLKAGWRYWLPSWLGKVFFGQALSDLTALERIAHEAFAKAATPWTTAWPLLDEALAQFQRELSSLAKKQEDQQAQRRAVQDEVELLSQARALRKQACQDALAMMHPAPQPPPGQTSTMRYLHQFSRAQPGRSEQAADMLWARFDARQDIAHRVTMFHLAARYWEGRWVHAELNAGGNLSYAQRLQRLMMLGVIVVGTTHKVIGLGKTAQADLLVMDEAGQCSPEVAVSVMAMGRTALLVGDIRQLQPVSLVTKDKALQIARQCAIDSLPDAFNPQGGSGMAVAQYASHLSDGGMDPGVTLWYHYRCHPGIIGYCNEMLYEGQMHIVRRAGPTPCGLPAISWVDVREATPDKQGGSWVNKGEIKEIVSWIEQSWQGLCTAYAKPLDQILAVITPLAAQAKLVKDALVERLEPLVGKEVADRMVIGTVHRLQGAERPVVAFSLVQHRSSSANLFADRDGGFLMNVAVSRAKDAFIIFGQRETLRPHASDEVAAPAPGNAVAPVARLGSYLREHGTRLYPRTLVVVEAPGKVGAVKAALGLKVAVLATGGTLRESSLDKSGTLKWSDPSTEFVKEMGLHAGLLDALVIATDDDLAGEMIGWQAAELAALHLGSGLGVRRMRFHDMVPEHLRLALELAGAKFDTQLLAAALLREYARHHDMQAFTRALKRSPYVSAPRRDLLQIVAQASAQPQCAVHLIAKDARGQHYQGFVPADASTLAGPLLLEPAQAQSLADTLRATGIEPQDKSSIVQIPALYPPSTTLRILSVAADELGIMPWDAQDHLNAMYQEGAR